jgi:hypothetical protein
MIIFEGHERWFKRMLLSKGNKFVTFWARGDRKGNMTLEDIGDMEDEFNITFTYVDSGRFIFRIN